MLEVTDLILIETLFYSLFPFVFVLYGLTITHNENQNLVRKYPFTGAVVDARGKDNMTDMNKLTGMLFTSKFG